MAAPDPSWTFKTLGMVADGSQWTLTVVLRNFFVLGVDPWHLDPSRYTTRNPSSARCGFSKCTDMLSGENSPPASTKSAIEMHDATESATLGECGKLSSSRCWPLAASDSSFCTGMHCTGAQMPLRNRAPPGPLIRPENECPTMPSACVQSLPLCRNRSWIASAHRRVAGFHWPGGTLVGCADLLSDASPG